MPSLRLARCFWISISLVGLAAPGAAKEKLICPTYPGTSARDYSKPCLKQEGDTAYPTLPGTSVRDYSRPGYRSEGKEIRQTIPGTDAIDYSAPGFVRDGKTIQPTLPGTSARDFSKPGYVIDGDLICPTMAGTSIRDYSASCTKRDGRSSYPTIPGTGVRDYSAPGKTSEVQGYSAPQQQPRQRERKIDSDNRDCRSVPGFCFDGRTFVPVRDGTTFRDYSRAGAIVVDDKLCPTVPGTDLRDYAEDCVGIRK